MRAQHAKVALDALIAAVDVLDARNARESVGLQARNHKRRARAKVGALDARAVQVLASRDDGHAPRDAHLRAHARQLVDMAVTVFKNILYKNGAARAFQKCRHQHRLRVRRKARIGRRAHRANGSETAITLEENIVLPAFDRAARLAQRAGHGRKRPRVDAAKAHLSPTAGRGAEIRRAHDAVGDDAVFPAVQRALSLDCDD